MLNSSGRDACDCVIHNEIIIVFGRTVHRNRHSAHRGIDGHILQPSDGRISILAVGSTGGRYAQIVTGTRSETGECVVETAVLTGSCIDTADQTSLPHFSSVTEIEFIGIALAGSTGKGNFSRTFSGLSAGRDGGRQQFGPAYRVGGTVVRHRPVLFDEINVGVTLHIQRLGGRIAVESIGRIVESDVESLAVVPGVNNGVEALSCRACRNGHIHVILGSGSGRHFRFSVVVTDAGRPAHGHRGVAALNAHTRNIIAGDKEGKDGPDILEMKNTGILYGRGIYPGHGKGGFCSETVLYTCLNSGQRGLQRAAGRHQAGFVISGIQGIIVVIGTRRGKTGKNGFPSIVLHRFHLESASRGSGRGKKRNGIRCAPNDAIIHAESSFGRLIFLNAHQTQGKKMILRLQRSGVASTNEKGTQPQQSMNLFHHSISYQKRLMSKPPITPKPSYSMGFS